MFAPYNCSDVQVAMLKVVGVVAMELHITALVLDKEQRLDSASNTLEVLCMLGASLVIHTMAGELKKCLQM